VSKDEDEPTMDEMDEPRGDDAAYLEGEPGEAVRDAMRADPVPPLDELTRRRLVSRALDEHVVGAPRRGRGPWLLSAAAAAVLVLVGTTVVLANRGGDGTESDRAGDATVATETERDEPQAAPTEADEGLADEEFADEGGTAEPTSLVDIGDLGEFDNSADLVAAAVTTARDAGASELTSGYGFTVEPCGDELIAATQAPTVVFAQGRATLRGEEARVLATTGRDGRRIALVLTADCEVFTEPL